MGDDLVDAYGGAIAPLRVHLEVERSLTVGTSSSLEGACDHVGKTYCPNMVAERCLVGQPHPLPNHDPQEEVVEMKGDEENKGDGKKHAPETMVQPVVETADELPSTDQAWDRALSQQEVTTGVVKKIFPDRKFGFARASGRNVFFHFRDLKGAGLMKGHEIKLIVGTDPGKGANAYKARKVWTLDAWSMHEKLECQRAEAEISSNILSKVSKGGSICERLEKRAVATCGIDVPVPDSDEEDGARRPQAKAIGYAFFGFGGGGGGLVEAHEEEDEDANAEHWHEDEDEDDPRHWYEDEDANAEHWPEDEDEDAKHWPKTWWRTERAREAYGEQDPPAEVGAVFAKLAETEGRLGKRAQAALEGMEVGQAAQLLTRAQGGRVKCLDRYVEVAAKRTQHEAAQWQQQDGQELQDEWQQRDGQELQDEWQQPDGQELQDEWQQQDEQDGQELQDEWQQQDAQEQQEEGQQPDDPELQEEGGATRRK
jgi:cold shock CspA family protein